MPPASTPAHALTVSAPSPRGRGLQVCEFSAAATVEHKFQRHRPGEGDCKYWAARIKDAEDDVSAPSPRGRGLQEETKGFGPSLLRCFSAIHPGKGTAR